MFVATFMSVPLQFDAFVGGHFADVLFNILNQANLGLSKFKGCFFNVRCPCIVNYTYML